MTQHTATSPSFMGFEPHGHCFLWQPDLIALHTVSDFVIGLSYYLIPFAIFYFVKKRRDIPFPFMFMLFGLFIISCGTTHLMSIWTIWTPDYWLEGFVKAATALFSFVTAMALFPLIPKALTIPSPAQLTAANQELEKEIASRTKAEAELQKHKDHLEDLVAERTSELRAANSWLEMEIKDRVLAEERLAKAQHYIRNIIDSMPSTLIGVDSNGTVTHWNLAAEKNLGLHSHEVEGKPLSEVYPLLSSYMDKVRMAVRDRKPVTSERQSFTKNGETRFQEVMIYPLIANGVEGAVVRVDDVTERTRISEIMIQSEKMASLGGLAAGMAHEINNPLSIILQSAQVIQRQFEPSLAANAKAAQKCGCALEDIRCYVEERGTLKFLDSIREAGARAASIVVNMLDFSRKSESRRVTCDLNELLDKSLELASRDYDLKKKYDFRHVEIIRDYAPDLPPVPCIRTEIEQVMLNLLKNAAQALSARPAEAVKPAITLRTRLAEGAVRIEIEDNGPGMDEKVRKRVFEPFFTTKEPGQGTGLGLSVSYFIITANHRGIISVESSPGNGTRFIIELPQGEVPSDIPGPVPAGP